MTSLKRNTYQPSQVAPRSVYVHIPFCRHRCGYCNFPLVAGRDYLVDRYLDALAIELSWLEKRYQVDTLFLGGGTPTHLTQTQLGRLFELLAKWFDFSDAEVSAEANPSDLVKNKVEILAELGVNRFSLGVQAFKNSKLELLERDHNENVVEQVISKLRKHDLNFSLDLIFATQGESLSDWIRELEKAIALEPPHLSTYELTIEKGTQFWRRHESGELVKSDEDIRAEMYTETISRLEQNGLKQYEVSSFSRSGFQCQHNLVYWSGLPYFAFGPGASRYVDGYRETNHASVSTYIKRLEGGLSPVGDSERLDDRERALELFVIGLRKIDGIRFEDFESLTQFSIADLAPRMVEELVSQGLLDVEAERIRLTPKGVMVYDSVATEILKAE